MDGAAFNGPAIQHGPSEPDLNAIALIGASCRLPGAPNLPALAALLNGGVDAVTEIPDERWNKAQLLHPDRSQPGKAYTFAAGIIDHVHDFDPAFFGISPREAPQIDPQQRLLLELAHEAVEDAGLNGARLAGRHVGVYVGGSSWDHSSKRVPDLAVSDAYTMTGSTLCSLANRISYAFDLHGPSFTVDTACSSSLVALHLACEAIRAGQVGMAFVGGVNMLLTPQSYIGFCRASMLSPQGRCHAFDSRADGYVRAEGGGVVLLKPLRTALEDGDRIRAVIRGTGVNSDGRTTGLSLPSKDAQAALLREVYGRFGIDPEQLSYVEAHGTGTPAGDPIEAGALGEVLGGARSRALPIGSVKTNIGHLEAGSGMAGLLKALLVIEQGRIPPSLNLQTPNPNIPFAALNLQLVPDAKTLEPDAAHLVGINSFGFGGTNAHAVLGSAPARVATPCVANDAGGLPLLISARSESALRDLAQSWRDLLRNLPKTDLLPVLRAAARAREQHPHRLAVLGADAAELTENLETFLAGRDTAGVLVGSIAPGADKTGIAFAFSGNGSQWAGMAADALHHSAAFRRALDAVDAVLRPLLGWSVVAALRETDAATMRDTSVAQPLLFAVQVAIVQALREAGIHASACFGHSVGEVAAAWAAGALTLEQAAQVITHRSQRQKMTQDVGGMAVLGAASDAAETLLADLPGIEIAAENSSSAVTVAGPADALAQLATLAEARRIPFTRLDLDYAFHSAAMDPIRAPLAQDLRDLQPHHAATKLVSTVTGARVSGTELAGEYWWRNVRDRVRFADAARSLVADGTRVFLEIGSQPVLQAYLHDALRSDDRVAGNGRVLATLGRRQAARDPFAIVAARCHVAGCDISTAPCFEGKLRADLLPRYPWQRERYELTDTAEMVPVTNGVQDHPLLGFRQGAAPDAWTRHLDTAQDEWLADHVVGGGAVLPAAAIIDLALGAARARHPDAPVLEILDLEINRAVALEAGALREQRVQADANGHFRFSTRPRLTGDGWTDHAAGRVVAGMGPATIGALPKTEIAQRPDAASLYATTAALGLEYGPAFRTVVGVDVFGDDMAVVRLAPSDGAAARAESGLLIDPTLLDGALQGLVALAAGRLGPDTAVLPWRFGRVRLLRPEGAAPVRAVLRVLHTGPRALAADIALLDHTGAVVAELLGCWFVSVQLGGKQQRRDAGFRLHEVRAADRFSASPAHDLLDRALAALPEDAEPAEAEALGEAAAALAAWLALREPAADAGLAQILRGWLAADGMGLDDGADLPPLDAVLQSLLFDSADVSAFDVALIARAVETLPDRLRGVAPKAPLLAQMLHHTPSGLALQAALTGAGLAMAQAWPHGQALRVLLLGAERDGALRMLRALRETKAAFHLTVAAAADALPTLAEALDGAPDAVAQELDTKAGPFDLALSLGQLTGGLSPDTLHAMLAPGGALLAAEPVPNRVWTLLGLAAPQDARHWQNALHDAGLLANGVRPVPAGLWPACLIAAVRPVQSVASPETAPGRVLVLAQPDDALADTLAMALRRQGQAVTPLVPGQPIDDAVLRDAGSIAVVVPPAADAAPWLAHLAALAAPLSANPLPLTVALLAAPNGDAMAGAVTGLLRVLRNEASDMPCRLVRLDPALPDHADILAREILHPDAEPETSWTATGPLHTRAARLPAPTRLAPHAVLDVARPGLLDTLRWQPSTPRAPGAGEVGIAIRAAGLNFRDVMWAMGLLPDEALLHGFAGPTLGLECAGVVSAVGPDVQDLRVGDRVMAFAPAALSTDTVTTRPAVVKLPDGMSFEQAATVPVAFLTTAYALGQLANLRAGETVLIHGGAGGVGLAAIQYALHRGATVIATAGSDAKRALLRQLGVAHVFDSRSLLFADDVMRVTGGVGVDVVLNSLSGEAMERSLRLLRPFGRFLELGKRDFYENTGIGLRPFRHNVSYFAIDADQLPNNRPDLAASLLAEVAALMADGALRPLPHRVFGFDAVTDAFRTMQGSHHIGKIVLVPPAEGVAVAAPMPAFTAATDGVYVITGGLTGFGLETAIWLAGQGARRLALLGRRGEATPGADAALARLEALGVSARAVACDVGNRAALAAALDDLRADMGPIRGVVHAAMVMDDGFLPSLDASRFARSIGPKWEGAENLDALTRQDDLHLFLLFSSITTALGNPGQGNYVAANAALEALAERRQAAGLPALAVGWGPIADAGYLAREAEVSEALARRLGTPHATAQQALAQLPAMLASGLPCIMQAEIGWGAASRQLPFLASPVFAALAEGGAEQGASTDLRSLIAGKTALEARSIVAGLLAEEIATILKLPAERIDPDRKLTELGMDSLMAVELRLAAETRFGVSLPLFSLAEGATLNSLALRLAKPLLGGEPDAGTNTGMGAGTAAGSAASDLLARLEPDTAAELALSEDVATHPDRPSYAAQAQNTV